jgi:phosphosulfolactate phosphohydrolase-like enzyme
MRIEVAFTPALLTDAARKVAVVIDVLRATTSLATMFSASSQEILTYLLFPRFWTFLSPAGSQSTLFKG